MANYQANLDWDYLQRWSRLNLARLRRQAVPVPGTQLAFWDSCTPAGARATEILNRWLTPHQRAVASRHGFIPVTGNRGGTWRIEVFNRVNNVHLVDSRGDRIATLCCGPFHMELPAGDFLLTQVLALQTDEARFTGKAHVAWAGPGAFKYMKLPLLRRLKTALRL